KKTKNITNNDSLKGLVKDDYAFLLKMPNDWKKIHIPDTREEDKNLSQEQREQKITEILNKINNPVVKHRLWLLVERLKDLKNKYGTPDNIIFEVAREEFISKDSEKYEELMEKQKENKKEIEQAVKKLEDSGIGCGGNNILKMRLFTEQGGVDIYDTTETRNLDETKFSEYEIDHIVPRSRKGSDSIENMVLTKIALNKSKINYTPYEWFNKEKGNKEKWDKFRENIATANGLSDYKKMLLISDRAAEIEKSRNDLQATAYIEKLAQQLTALYFGWGLNTKDDIRKIFVSTGVKTAQIRKNLSLNSLLHKELSEIEVSSLVNRDEIEEKNRKNKKHHALDALVLSIARDCFWNYNQRKYMAPPFFNKPFVEKQLTKVIPEKIKYTSPKVAATIYGIRETKENGKDVYYIIGPKVKSKFKKEDLIINDKGMRQLGNYIELKPRQFFTNDKEHRGQIVYKVKNTWKVEPIYVWDSEYKKKKEFKQKYGQVYFFKAGQLVSLEELSVGDKPIKKGIYILRGLNKAGQAKIESIETQKEFRPAITALIEKGKMKTYTNLCQHT
ncbi:MAG: hypothetical protein LBM71_05425, partial [Elusimicrobiota bacterium]|nr:hypothetical protein [Elusimicrobiota bacterium]